MSKFMDWLRTEINNISEKDIISPDCEVRDGEVVIGTVESLEIKKIYTVLEKLRKEGENIIKENPMLEMFLDGISTRDPKKLKKLEGLKRQLEVNATKIKTLSKLMWTSIRFEISEEQHVKNEEAGHDSVGVRDDWQIVSFEDEGLEIGSIIRHVVVGMRH